MNNLQIFRKATDTFLQADNIESIDKWKQLMDYLCDRKIFSPKQIKILNQNVIKRTFPIKIPQFQQILMKQFGDEGTKNLLKDISHIQKQIKQTKGVLAVWKQQGLSQTQIKQLQILFAKGNNKMKQICYILKDKKQLLQSISQPQIQLINSLDEWTIMQKIILQYKNYQQFQQINNKAIDNLYNMSRVRQVHFKNKKNNNNKISQQVIVLTTGFNSKTDQQVQVTKIPKKLNDFDKINTTLVTSNAQRDLMLSPYFIRFLGYNTNADPNHYYYFREYIKTINLQTLIKKSNVSMNQNYSIFKYWVGEMFRGFRDMYYQCSYEPVLPVRLKDIEIADYGLRVIFKHVKFNIARDDTTNIQPILLQNLGKIILQLLRIQQNQIQDKIKNIQNRSLLYCLLKAKQGLKKYQQKIVPCYINFYNAQTHPLFQSIHDTQGMEIIDNFTIIFGDYV